jgi:hypothetical protein
MHTAQHRPAAKRQHNQFNNAAIQGPEITLAVSSVAAGIVMCARERGRALNSVKKL